MKTTPIKPADEHSTAEEKIKIMRGQERIFPQTIEEVEAMEKELEKEAPPDLSILEDAESLWQKIVAITSASDEGCSNSGNQDTIEIQPRLPLTAMLKKRSKLKAKEIAARLRVTPELLSNFGDHPKVLRFRARKELDDRAAATIPGVKPGDVIECTEEPVYQAKAAYSDKPFVPQEITYKSLVLRSGLNEKQQEFWLSLDGEE